MRYHNETMLCDEYLDVVTRGVLWACNKIDEQVDPIQGYAGTGKAKIILPYMMKDLISGPSPAPAEK
ncbi:MAG: hypothetical protein AAF623_18175 [Planctomycetota bacterium]